jgi:RNA polymerase sigma factor (sigma-70 family)
MKLIEQESINILIAEDQNLLAKLMLVNLTGEPGFNIVGVARDGNEAIEMLESNKVDVLLLDINMPNIDGIQVLHSMRPKMPDLKVIMLSSMYEGWMIKNAITAGANAYVSKNADYEEIKKAIFTVLRGESYFCKYSFNSFMNNMSHSEDEQKKSHRKKSFGATEQVTDTLDEADRFRYNCHNLTQREREIFKLIVDEKTTKDISEELYISPRTVETHRKNILQKLGLKNSMKLIKLAVETNFNDLN